jgi:hypothetical protein
VWDITAALVSGSTDQSSLPPAFELTYYALAYGVGGTDPSDAGCGGNIIMSASVSFYDF